MYKSVPKKTEEWCSKWDHLPCEREDAGDRWLPGIIKDLSLSRGCKVIPDNVKELNCIQERKATRCAFHSA